jgi:hypothetical protein
MDLSKYLPASWRTSLGGLIVFLGVLSTELSTLIDEDPKTNPNIGLVVAAFGAAFGFGSARDKGVSTEQERGRPVSVAQELSK